MSYQGFKSIKNTAWKNNKSRWKNGFLDYEDIQFPVSKKDFDKIEKKNNIWINVFCYENNLVYPASALDQKFENSTSLLTIANENKSHYVYIKDFNRFVCDKTKSEKNMFASIVYNVLVVLEHK